MVPVPPRRMLPAAHMGVLRGDGLAVAEARLRLLCGPKYAGAVVSYGTPLRYARGLFRLLHAVQ